MESEVEQLRLLARAGGNAHDASQPMLNLAGNVRGVVGRIAPQGICRKFTRFSAESGELCR
jgi:hypothetical protein